jgi:hypothetical protein
MIDRIWNLAALRNADCEEQVSAAADDEAVGSDASK